MVVSGSGEERTRIGDYRGLARTNPVAAALMTLFLLSLAQNTPTAGFIAKVNVFSAAIDAGYWVLALIGVLASVAAAFFYLRVIVLMYMQEPESAAPGFTERARIERREQRDEQGREQRCGGSRPGDPCGRHAPPRRVPRGDRGRHPGRLGPEVVRDVGVPHPSRT